MTPSWTDWPKIENKVAKFLRDKEVIVEEVKNKAEQYKDIDLLCESVKGGRFAVSVKYMPKALQTGNISFETKLIAEDGREIPGWFVSGKSDYTVIVVPTPEDKLRMLMWKTSTLKARVPGLSHRTASLSLKQKQFNKDRTFNSSEFSLVRLKEIIPFAIQDVILPDEPHNNNNPK